MDVSSVSVTTIAAAVDITNATLQVDTITMDVSSVSVTTTAAAIDISNATLQVDTIAMDVSSVSVTTDSAAIDISNATLQVDTIAMDVSSVSVTTDSAAIDISSATLQVDTIVMDVSSVYVITDLATIDISSATLQVDTVTMDVSSAIIDICNATIDICSGTVAISNVTLSGDLGVLSNADAFDRLRVSNPFTLFEFTSTLGKQSDIIDEQISGSGTSTAITGDSYISMQVSGVGSVIRQTHEYIPYQPGKSKLIYMTGVLQDPSGRDLSGIITRIGSFDASMGFYIESSGGIVSVVQHNSVFERAYRDPSNGLLSWNDPLDGTGPSGVIVDFRKAQIFMFDFAWLGVGQVRCGVIIGGKPIYYYTFTHTNILTMPYIPMAKLPLRYEITGSLGATQSELRMLCGTALSEGGYTPITRVLTDGLYTGTAKSITKGVGVGLVPLLAIKIRQVYPFNRVSIKLKSIDIFNTTGGNSGGAWVALLNPDLSGGTFTDYNSSISAAQICKTGMVTNLTGGSILFSGFYATRDYNQLNSSIDELNASQPITMGLSGNPDIVVIAANNLGATAAADLYYFVKWVEYI
jgi:hypothetical protein